MCYIYIQDDLPETARQTKKRALDLLLDENKETKVIKIRIWIGDIR